VFDYARTQSIVALQRRFRTKFGKDPPMKNSIKQWYEKFKRDGCEDESSLPSQESIGRRVWAEMDYRLDVCRVTKGEHRAFEVCKINLGGFSFYRYVAFTILCAIQVYRFL
jgi:hypothetical protein